MVDHQFGGVIQIFVEEDTRSESSESGRGGSQSVFDIFSRGALDREKTSQVREVLNVLNVLSSDGDDDSWKG